MRKIVCYRKGCHHPAEYEIPGPPTLYLCRICLLDLYPSGSAARLRVGVGPTEFKLSAQEEQQMAEGILATTERVRRGNG